MNAREKILGKWSLWAFRKSGRALLLVLLVTLILGTGFARLSMEMTFYSILPRNSSHVRDLEYMVEEFPFASQIMAVVDARHIEDDAEAKHVVKQTVDAMIEEFPALPDIVNAYGHIDRDFLRKRSLMLMKPKDMIRFSEIYSDLNFESFLANLNNDYEREYSGQEDNLEDDELIISAQFEGLSGILSQLQNSLEGRGVDEEALNLAVDQFMLGESYFLSRDSKMGIVFLLPSFTMNDVGKLKQIIDYEEKAREIAARYGAEAGLTGMIVVGKDEMVTSEQGLGLGMLVAFFLIITLMIVVFRMKSVPFTSGIPLIVGILWTLGITGWVVHRLNIMTAMYMVALIGLGIDYAIHLLAAYRQNLDQGYTGDSAIYEAFQSSGPGIITGALTTSAAFFALTLSSSEVVSELGLVAGLGILCEMTAMFMIIPAILGIRYKRRVRKGRDLESDQKVLVRSDFIGKLGSPVTAKPVVFIVVFMALAFILGSRAGRVGMEDNLMNMEAKGLHSIELQDTLVDEMGMAPDGLSILTDNLNELHELTNALDDLDSVKSVDSLASWLPSAQQFDTRIALAETLIPTWHQEALTEEADPALLEEELMRLEMNLVEMGDMAFMANINRLLITLNKITGLDNEGEKTGDSQFDALFSALESADSEGLQRFRNLYDAQVSAILSDMAVAESYSAADLPDIAVNSFLSRDGQTFLMTINPRQNPWVGGNRHLFTSQVESVTPKATGMILAADQMNTVATSDGILAAGLALLVVFVLLLLDFRNLKLTLLTFVPLILSFLALFGFMGWTGISFDFLNIIAVPLLIGIGIDDAVHINHRYRKEGPGGMKRVIALTGTAVFLTTMTTVIGFASFIPSVMRAMRSTGIVLSLAMIFAFVFSVFLHPALLMLLKEKARWNFDSWGKGE